MNIRHIMLTLFLGVVSVVSASVSQIVLSERGKLPETVILLPKHAEPSVKYAAEEIQRCIAKMTDVKLPICEENSKRAEKAISLIPTDDYGSDGFRIRAKNETLEISGGKRGILYGAFELLETYGECGWFASWHEVIPRRDVFSVPSDLDDTQKPAFVMRMPTWQDIRECPEFAAKLRVNGYAAKQSSAAK